MTGLRHTVVTKPSRSDDVLDATHQLLIYDQVRAQFDSLAPKRPIKPNRSEPHSISATITPPDEDVHLPELDKLRSLQNQPQAAFPEAAPPEQEEFVETEYYKALESVNKQHHTTGSGFIKADGIGSSGNGYEIVRHDENNGRRADMVLKSNPATNDWTPKFEDHHQVGFVSSKPNRSETS